MDVDDLPGIVCQLPSERGRVIRAGLTEPERHVLREKINAAVRARLEDPQGAASLEDIPALVGTEGELLSIAEAARRTGRDKAWLHSLGRTGRLRIVHREGDRVLASDLAHLPPPREPRKRRSSRDPLDLLTMAVKAAA